jgi:hypothetical protein
MTEVEKYFYSILVSAFNEIERVSLLARLPETLFRIMSSPEVAVRGGLLMVSQTLSKVDDKYALAKPKAIECQMKETAQLIVKNQRVAFMGVSDDRGEKCKGDSYYILNSRSGDWKSVHLRDRHWQGGWFRSVNKLMAMNDASAIRFLSDEGFYMEGRFEDLRFVLGLLAASDFGMIRNPPHGLLDKLEAMGSRLEEMIFLETTQKDLPLGASDSL